VPAASTKGTEPAASTKGTLNRQRARRVLKMSLRMFHLFFIALAVALSAFVAAWATGQYRLEHEMPYAVTGVGAVAAAIALAVYGARFQRKTRQL